MSALPGTTGRRRIYLLRHGHVDYFGAAARDLENINDVPLTELGQEQAAAAGQALAHVNFDRALCSGLPRTEQTAQLILRQQQNTPPKLEARHNLAEIGTGRLIVLKSREQLAALITFHFDNAASPGARLMENGELFVQAYDRAIGEIETLLDEPDWHTMFIVAHEGINRLILGWATGNGLNAVQAFEQDLACINILDFDLVPRADHGPGIDIARKIIKAVNLTPYNLTKHGMNLTSFEALFTD